MTMLLQETLVKAEQGDAKAMTVLSRWHDQGEQGLERSPAKSLDWAAKAAALGHAEALRLMGVKTEFGQGLPGSFPAAFDWYRRAFEAGDAEAACQLAFFFEGEKGMAAHLPTAIAYYEEGAKRGSGRAQYQLAFRCLDGQGVPRDAARACLLLEQAGQGGVPSAFETLGKLYLHGPDVPRDPARAFESFTRALEFFDVDPAVAAGDCAVYYALCLLTGTGCAENRKLGRDVLEVAATAANPLAAELLRDRVVRNPAIQAAFNPGDKARKRGVGANWDISALLG